MDANRKSRARASRKIRRVQPDAIPGPLPPLTVGGFLEYLCPRLLADPTVPSWPPDVFALVAMVLLRSDAYPCVVERWPPNRNSADWIAEVKRHARRWRKVSTLGATPPKAVTALWQEVWKAWDTTIAELRESPALAEAMLELCSISDEASAGAGLIDPYSRGDDFEDRCVMLLTRPSSSGTTLCVEVDPARVSVLPKAHTPQCGMTIRSLSHYLAVVDRREVVPSWSLWPAPPKERHRLNLLLLPWPLRMDPQHFVPSPATLGTMPKGQGFFTTATAPVVEFSSVKACVASAKKIAGHIDAVVFPELALHEGDPERMCKDLGCVVIGGVGQPGAKRVHGTNAAAVAFPYAISWAQHKHHRWKLTSDQVKQYALGKSLDPSKEWWEYIRIPKRELNFLSVSSWLTYCVLICEDLARQDPVAEVVRSVGPDLVIALLMDGPQLVGRWPARYAGVLADDPGCSVLTLTSLGMVTLSCASGWPESRVVAMWKDSRGGARELPLFQGAEGLLLSLKAENREEFTADGRSDKKESTHLTLEQVHQVFPSR